MGKGRRAKCGSPRGSKCALARLRVFGVDERHLVYRKGLSYKILKHKERERKLAAQKEMGGLAIGEEEAVQVCRACVYPT